MYIGQTIGPHPIVRVLQHRPNPWWQEVARADYVEVLEGDLDIAERGQIAELRPKYNRF